MILKNPLGLFLALAFGIGIGSLVTWMWVKTSVQNTPVRLEEVLVVKELHLVRYVYNDMFFLHRRNDKAKAIRAIAQVPVTVTAYLNLKEMQWIRRNDSIKKIILPKARLHEPSYDIDQMEIKETRGFQLHVGYDLYPKVGQYLSQIMAERQDTIRQIALNNNILIQAEVEGKQYIEGLLRNIGRADVQVTFGDEAKDHLIAEIGNLLLKANDTLQNPKPSAGSPVHSTINNVFYGLLPLD